jgi:hypothetical protein
MANEGMMNILSIIGRRRDNDRADGMYLLRGEGSPIVNGLMPTAYGLYVDRLSSIGWLLTMSTTGDFMWTLPCGFKQYMCRWHDADDDGRFV